MAISKPWQKVVKSTKTEWMNKSIVLLFSAIVSGCASTDTVHHYQDNVNIQPDTTHDSKCESLIIRSPERSDYDNAIQEYLPLAEQDDETAQFMLGGLYYQKAAVSPNAKAKNLFIAST